MSNIKVMDEVLANTIAAGEVVERTLNVVKELVENSIDAKSTSIKIKLTDAGVKEIIVEDNGIGMDREDARLAFLRHATSKLKKVDDLFHIATLGFRGEALPSIASVAIVDLTTSQNQVGTHVVVEAGTIKTIESCDLQQGTTIKVRDLFYNTPVRLKYLKNLYTELALIVEYVNKMALSYPSIKFVLINNDKELLNTAGDGNLLKVIYAVYGIDVAKKMLAINGENEDYVVSGYISYPEVAKTARSVMTTLVNGRVIRNLELNRTILEAYHTYIPKDKYPIVVLNIDVDPILIDINIHPQKMDIKFSKAETLKSLVTDLITKKLKEVLLIPHANVRDIATIAEVQAQMPLAPPKSPFEIEDVVAEVKPEIVEVTFDLETEITPPEEKTSTEYRIKEMYPVGIVHKTYIIAENDDGMFIIDQHAAAERINYEKYLKALSAEQKDITNLLVPIRLEFSKDAFIRLKQHLDVLTSIGIQAEEFGDNTLIIRSHPTWLFQGYEKESIEKIIAIILEHGEFVKEKFVEKTAITLACRLSIKANDYISKEEMKYLLDNLRKCENPFTCPHGRPTIITYSNYDLERLFKRAMN